MTIRGLIIAAFSIVIQPRSGTKEKAKPADKQIKQADWLLMLLV